MLSQPTQHKWVYRYTRYSDLEKYNMLHQDWVSSGSTAAVLSIEIGSQSNDFWPSPAVSPMTTFLQFNISDESIR
jgi:beta-glucanase (GH16 family)